MSRQLPILRSGQALGCPARAQPGRDHEMREQDMQETTTVPAISMTNQDLIRRFETNSLPDDSFHHADHVRLAFAYLTEYPTLDALQKFTSALKNFAAAHGKPQLYHETITCAYFFLIRERMVRDIGLSWEEFARRNPDLLIWKNGILIRYYGESTLKSDLARNVFVLPDRCLDRPVSAPGFVFE